MDVPSPGAAVRAPAGVAAGGPPATPAEAVASRHARPRREGMVVVAKGTAERVERYLWQLARFPGAFDGAHHAIQDAAPA